ncbi:MAG TPA: orotate phosphoribosyltransferase [Puia sp.]|nr:orotate phosphoribosyltransferase [Puia sp.]
MNNARVIAEKLLHIQAVKLSPANPYTWASGWKSPVYCDNRKVLSFPYIRDFIKSEMCNMVFDRFPNADLVAGVATAGIAWGAMIADMLKIPFIYVRAKPKEHGLGNQIEGFFEEGQQVVVVEDLISTGKSSLDVIEVLKFSGLQIAGLVSIFTYGFSVAEEAFAKAGVNFASLTDYQSLIEVAIEKGILSANDEAMLLNWKKNPSEWKGVL